MNRACVSPDGFVAQRFDHDFNGHGHWLLMHMVDGNLTATALTDEDVKDWRPLVPTSRCNADQGAALSAAIDLVGAWNGMSQKHRSAIRDEDPLLAGRITNLADAIGELARAAPAQPVEHAPADEGEN